MDRWALPTALPSRHPPANAVGKFFCQHNLDLWRRENVRGIYMYRSAAGEVWRWACGRCGRRRTGSLRRTCRRRGSAAAWSCGRSSRRRRRTTATRTALNSSERTRRNIVNLARTSHYEAGLRVMSIFLCHLLILRLTATFRGESGTPWFSSSNYYADRVWR